MNTQISHQRLAELVEGELYQGDPNGVVTGINSLSAAVAGEASFLGNSRYEAALQTTQATAILVGPDFQGSVEGKALIRVANPTFAFSAVIRLFSAPPRDFTPGVHPTAYVSPKARFDAQKVSIGACAVVEDDVVIGDGTLIDSGAVIEPGAKIGTDCIIHSNAVLGERCILGHRVILHSGTVIGGDGFGYEFVKGRHVKVDQHGIVQIDDDVEIGANSTIDRARFGRTWIGQGTKIDNLVQIAHNAVIGKHCIIVSQTGIAGSAKIGDYVTIAAQSGVAGHLEVHSQTTLLGRSGVTKNITAPGAYLGFPTRPLMEGRRLMASQARVPELIERINKLEKLVAQLQPPSAEA